MLLDALDEQRWGGLLEQERRGPDAHRKQYEAAQPEGEREWRGPDADVVWRDAGDRARKAVADRQHVAVEVHRPLRVAGRARRERDQHRIVRGRVAILEPVSYTHLTLPTSDLV